MTKHVVEHGWTLIDIYCDDGFSGTNQNRPALQKMLQAVTQGHINTVLVKDLSRLGRNYLEVGNLAEVFLPEHGCDLISLAEQVDEMMVFHNWFNEQHSRETSKKVKTVKKMYAESGKFLGAFAPYGYRKSEKNKHLLIPDETAATVVREIFKLRSEGMGYKAIANHLNNAGVLPPRDYYYQKRDGINPFHINHNWGTVTIKNILDNEVYIGNTVSFKYGTTSYKSHRLMRKSEDEWIHTKNTHEPIISKELWEQVQGIATKRYSPHDRRDGPVSIFCGLLFCGGCGFKMRRVTQKRIRKNGNQYVNTSFTCGTYARSGKIACTPHTIGEKALCQIILEQIKTHAKIAARNEKVVVESILKTQVGEAAINYSTNSDELDNLINSMNTLDKDIEKLYEDRLEGLVPETTFRNLIWKYEQERDELSQTSKNLEAQIRSSVPFKDGINKWVGMIKQYTQIEVLDAQTLLTLTERIVVGDRIKIADAMAYDVKIIYKYVGDVSWLELDAKWDEPI